MSSEGRAGPAGWDAVGGTGTCRGLGCCSDTEQLVAARTCLRHWTEAHPAPPLGLLAQPSPLSTLPLELEPGS